MDVYDKVFQWRTSIGDASNKNGFYFSMGRFFKRIYEWRYFKGFFE